MSSEKNCNVPKGANLARLDDKSRPNPDGRTALIAVSLNQFYFEDEHLKAIIESVKKAGRKKFNDRLKYEKVKVVIGGGSLYANNYFLQLAIKQAEERHTADELYYDETDLEKKNGKKIHELTERELEKFAEQMKGRAEEFGVSVENEWLAKYKQYFAVLEEAGIKVEFIRWNEAEQSKESDYEKCRELVEKENEKVNGYKQCVDNALWMMRTHNNDKCKVMEFRNGYHTHRKFFKAKDREYIHRETAVFIGAQFKDCDFYYPMEFSKLSKQVIEGMQTVITKQKIQTDIKFYTVNFIYKKSPRKDHSGLSSPNGSEEELEENHPEQAVTVEPQPQSRPRGMSDESAPEGSPTGTSPTPNSPSTGGAHPQTLLSQQPPILQNGSLGSTSSGSNSEENSSDSSEEEAAEAIVLAAYGLTKARIKHQTAKKALDKFSKNLGGERRAEVQPPQSSANMPGSFFATSTKGGNNNNAVIAGSPPSNTPQIPIAQPVLSHSRQLKRGNSNSSN